MTNPSFSRCTYFYVFSTGNRKSHEKWIVDNNVHSHAQAVNFSVFQVDLETTGSVVTVDWENGFVEASAKDNTNVSQVFKELLTQAKLKYNLSPALRKRRRQSLPRHSISEGSASTSANSSAIPSPAQLQHLHQIQQRHTGGKRNSCTLS